MDARMTGEHLRVSEAGDWAAIPRSRILLSTLPYQPDGGPYPREEPWDEGWLPRIDGELEPMMRAQGFRNTPDGA
eukprot:3577839-Lingulodinium_polyedra.AAC.1